MVYLTQN